MKQIAKIRLRDLYYIKFPNNKKCQTNRCKFDIAC